MFLGALTVSVVELSWEFDNLIRLNIVYSCMSMWKWWRPLNYNFQRKIMQKRIHALTQKEKNKTLISSRTIENMKRKRGRKKSQNCFIFNIIVYWKWNKQRFISSEKDWNKQNDKWVCVRTSTLDSHKHVFVYTYICISYVLNITQSCVCFLFQLISLI